MPYILSPEISQNSPGMWAEGVAYEKKSIYSIESGKMPPVNYDEHIIRPHSLTHLETPAHTMAGGKRLDSYFNEHDYFYGKTVVLKFEGNNYKSIGNGVFHWVITLEEWQKKIADLKIDKLPNKILFSTSFYPTNSEGYHDPNYVLTLSQDVADTLVSLEGFNLYGTSWKSSDFNPGKPERPIHNTLFQKAVILENLDLKIVPEGIYILTAFPLPLKGASESPVVPVLFTKEELLRDF